MLKLVGRKKVDWGFSPETQDGKPGRQLTGNKLLALWTPVPSSVKEHVGWLSGLSLSGSVCEAFASFQVCGGRGLLAF